MYVCMYIWKRNESVSLRNHYAKFDNQEIRTNDKYIKNKINLHYDTWNLLIIILKFLKATINFNQIH